MKSELFLIAEYVSIADGKFTIVNTFDRINSPEFPFVFRPFGIACTLRAEKGERGKEFGLTLVLRKGNKDIVSPLPIKVNFPKFKQKMPVRFHGAFGLVGVTFQEPGTHVIELRRQQKVLCSRKLYVVKQPGIPHK